ncbi:MAG: Gfo/Idh/MocA family protein, partial [Gammaproteobacteria bacterium]
MQKIKWGVIGPGSIATGFAHSIKHCQNSELTSVFGRNEKKAKVFAELFGLHSFSSLQDFIGSDAVDAVYVATPHSDHFVYALEAIKHKKHVLCEKPLTMNAHESMILLDLAQSSNVFLMEAYMYRTHPQTLNILNNL